MKHRKKPGMKRRMMYLPLVHHQSFLGWSWPTSSRVLKDDIRSVLKDDIRSVLKDDIRSILLAGGWYTIDTPETPVFCQGRWRKVCFTPATDSNTTCDMFSLHVLWVEGISRDSRRENRHKHQLQLTTTWDFFISSLFSRVLDLLFSSISVLNHAWISNLVTLWSVLSMHRKLIFKSSRLVPFDANLAKFMPFIWHPQL